MINYKLVWTQGEFAIDGDSVWFVPYWITVLCEYNLKTNKMEKVIHFSDHIMGSASYYNVKKVGNLVIAIPAFEKHICIYDVVNETMTLLEVPIVKCQCEKFLFCSVWDESIFLFPIGYKYVVKMNLQTRKISVIDIINDECRTFVAMTQIDEKIYLVNETNKIYVFHMDQERFEVFSNEDSSKKYRTITHRGKTELILSDSIGNLYLQSLDDVFFEKNYIEGHVPYDSSMCIGDYIFLMPIFEKEYIVKIDMNTNIISKIYIDVNNNYLKWPHTVFSKPVYWNDVLYVFSTQYRILFLYNVVTGEKTSCQLEMPIMDDREIEELFLREQGRSKIEEGSGQYAALEKFILCSRKDNFNEINRNEIGKKIHRKILEIDDRG